MAGYTASFQITLWLPPEGLKKEPSRSQTTGHPEDDHLGPIQRLRPQD